MSEPAYKARESLAVTSSGALMSRYDHTLPTVNETPLPRMGADDETVTNLFLFLLKAPSACNSEGLLPFPCEFTGRALLLGERKKTVGNYI